MNPPTWFVRELDDFDSDLRLRWSARLELWQIERRVRRSIHPGTIHCNDWHDDAIRARDGYVLVAGVPPNGLSRQIFSILKESDLWSQGGWKRVADKLDEWDESEENRVWEKFSEDMQAYSKELYNFLSLREGRTVYSAGWPS